MITLPTIAHHSLSLLLPPGNPETVGSATHLAKIKEASKGVGRIERSLAMAGRVEVAMVQPELDFFDGRSGMNEVRRAITEMACQTRHLRLVALTAEPDNFARGSKEPARGDRVKNLCIGLVAERVDGWLDDKLRALHLLPSQFKMLLLHSLEQPPDLGEKLAGLDWLILCTTAANSGWADQARATCQAVNVAFLHLVQDDPAAVLHNLNGTAMSCPGSESIWREHPFGDEVSLRRPTLKGLERPAQLVLNLEGVESDEVDRGACMPVSVAAAIETASDVTTTSAAVEESASPTPEAQNMERQLEVAFEVVSSPMDSAATAHEGDAAALDTEVMILEDVSDRYVPIEVRDVECLLAKLSAFTSQDLVNGIKSYAGRAEVLANESLAVGSRALICAWACGIMLNKAKANCGHGKFATWIQKHLKPMGISERTCQRYMSLARKCPDLHLLVDSNLGLKQAYKTFGIVGQALASPSEEGERGGNGDAERTQGHSPRAHALLSAASTLQMRLSSFSSSGESLSAADIVQVGVVIGELTTLHKQLSVIGA
jgi:hypothetical protein